MVRAFGIVSLAAALGASPLLAQTAPVTRHATIAPGKPARIWTVTALKRDCSVGEVGTIRLVTPPKNGSVVIRAGNAKTPASFRCPNKDTAVQQLLYQPNARYQGDDELTFETRTPDGDTQTLMIKLTISDKKPAAKPDVLEL